MGAVSALVWPWQPELAPPWRFEVAPPGRGFRLAV